MSVKFNLTENKNIESAFQLLLIEHLTVSRTEIKPGETIKRQIFPIFKDKEKDKILSRKNIHHVYLKPIIGPAAKLHNTCLLIKREVLHIHLTGGVIDGRRSPFYFPCAV